MIRSSLAESSEVQNVRGLVTLEGRGHAYCVLCVKNVLKCHTTISCVFLVSIIVHADMMWNRSPWSMSTVRDLPGWEQEVCPGPSSPLRST